MASYLLSLKISGATSSIATIPVPADYVVDWTVESTNFGGLDVWAIELQMAGSVADWSKGKAYDAMWTYIESHLAVIDVRPRASLTIKSRTDPHRIAATFTYFGDQQIKKAKSDLKAKIENAVDPKSNRIKTDINLVVH